MFPLIVCCLQKSAKLDKTKFLFMYTKLRNYVRWVRLPPNRNTQGHKNYLHSKFNVFHSTTRKMTQTKDLCLMDYDIIGFDLDGTLLRYNLHAMSPLVYNLLIKYLVETVGYPKALLEKQFNADFIQKGLFIDADHGNVVKLAADGSVLRATHGTTLLSVEEIQKIYGKSCRWHLAEQFMADPLSIWNGPNAIKIRIVLDYFDCASALVFAQAVDVLDSKSKTQSASPTMYSIYPDILKGLIQIYTAEHFSNGQSGYFEALKSQPCKYLMRTKTKVITWLKNLRSSGKAVYLLTGSNIDFAHFTATYALGPDWRDLFDFVLCYAKKPGFFFMKRPFLKVNNLHVIPNSELNENERLVLGETYSQGNWHQLRDSFNHHLIHKKDIKTINSLYIGDNLIQDVYAPVKCSDLKAIAISEELWATDNNYEFQAIVESKFWGSYFALDNVPTVWSRMIEENAQLCIPNLDVIAEIPIADKIHCENRTGYFPHLPNAVIV